MFDHPQDRFTAGDFQAELARQDLKVGENWRVRLGGDLLFGVAERRSSSAPGALRTVVTRRQSSTGQAGPEQRPGSGRRPAADEPRLCSYRQKKR